MTTSPLESTRFATYPSLIIKGVQRRMVPGLNVRRRRRIDAEYTENHGGNDQDAGEDIQKL